MSAPLTNEGGDVDTRFYPLDRTATFHLMYYLSGDHCGSLSEPVMWVSHLTHVGACSAPKPCEEIPASGLPSDLIDNWVFPYGAQEKTLS